MSDRDSYTIDAMALYGGGFVKALANAARRADSFNLQKIKDAFPEYWSKYEKLGVGIQKEEEKFYKKLKNES